MYIYNCERMKLPSCPRTLIINILRKNPDGLTLTSIAELTGLHRHTATKYIYELKGAGVINERDVGSAKLCYLKEGFSREEQKKVVGRLNGKGWRKSSTGQVQILTLFMFLFMVPASIIIAQNATQGMNSTGELILGQINATAETFTKLNQTGPETANGTSFIEANITAIINESNETIPSENQTNFPEQNYTAEENLTEANETISNGTVSNETAQNETILNETAVIPEPENMNETIQELENETQLPEELPEILQPVLSVRISSQDKILRGEQFDVSAIISNSGNSDAKNVRMEWILPEGIEIVSGQASAECGIIVPDSECASSLTLLAPISADIGKNEIMVVMKYEE
jgi:predicted transcriptional regulator